MAAFVRRPLTGWDVADILIVSVLIYEALKLIRGTRAMQMAIGSVLVLFLFYTSRLFPLQTVNWLIRNVLSYGVFAAIVWAPRVVAEPATRVPWTAFFITWIIGAAVFALASMERE